ncbi:MAG: exopolyphosphatase [Rhodospirillaceae bacterium]|nr:exopolyphosphatase [Magnetovibrio sp.]MAY66342.1 exopolyphosphatase [Rhodospirillaceae bacterium]
MSLFRDNGAGDATAKHGLLGDDRDHGRVAVVDIGSSSVRLVVYDTPARLPVPIFNEKSDCGLVRGLAKTGKLNKKGVARARAALARFIRLAKVMGVDRLELVATAAVRDAADGLQFVAEIEDTFNVAVQIPSGAEEARLSALGLLIGVPKADGLLGDLGGGSLDLIGLDSGQFGASATLPLGHLRLPDAVGGDIRKAGPLVEEQFAQQEWLKDIRGRTLFAVGGSWRVLARIFIEQSRYPIHIIDGFTMGYADLRHLCQVLSGLSKDSLQQMPIPRRRIDSLPFAALAMDKLLNAARPEKIVFSGFGMREGQMIKGLPKEIRSQDPLIAGCETLAERSGRFTVSGAEMRDWMSPLFPEEPARHARLRYVACLLSDIGWTEHPDYRAEHAFLRVLRLPYAGLAHLDRAFLAMAVLVRYNGNPEISYAAPALHLLDEDDRRVANAVGLALRLGHTVSGSAPDLIGRTALKVSDGKLFLCLPAKDRAVFTGDAVERRLKTLATAMGFSGADFGEI